MSLLQSGLQSGLLEVSDSVVADASSLMSIALGTNVPYQGHFFPFAVSFPGYGAGSEETGLACGVQVAETETITVTGGRGGRLSETIVSKYAI